ncbi:hypothetical protein [Actinokineospora sp.]|uniref:hypothetical protein n=1 Tax=Actinokineospora sp. TaxID=1872133 RepID=UPI003D6B1D83
MSTLARAVLLFVVVVAIAKAKPAEDGTTVPTLDSHGTDVEYSANCDEHGRASDVVPNTKAARDAANARCAQTHEALKETPWPSGVSQVPFPFPNGGK